jgi:Spy/CpxP family protein refolding chaperone
MRTLLVVGLAGTLLIGPLAAQTPGQGMGMGGMHQGQGGMQGQGMGMMVPGPLRKYMAFSPSKLLEMKAMLELSGDQEAKLTALQDAAKKQSEDAHAPAHAAMQSLQQEMTSASPDLAKVEGYFKAHNMAMGNTQWVAVSTALQARAVLTDGQRKHVEEMAGDMGGMGGMGHGTPPNKP